MAGPEKASSLRRRKSGSLPRFRSEFVEKNKLSRDFFLLLLPKKQAFFPLVIRNRRFEVRQTSHEFRDSSPENSYKTRRA